MDVDVKDIQVIRLKTNKIMMEGTTAKFYHGRVCGVIGARRDDTTTLLDVLSGRAHYATVNGTIRVNGNIEKKMSSFHNIVGYVSYKDIFHTSFKVREVIRFAAHARLPRATTFSEIGGRMDNVMNALGIDWIQNKHIGKKKTDPLGLNLYQRKLINVAMELVAEPSFLIVDHPIDEIEYTEAFQLVRLLRGIAASGVSVVCSIDKPRYEVFTQFDDILLLGTTGETIYNGPSYACAKYFEELGF